MYILGKNKDDKGTQLEQLTHELLKAMDYTNIVTNAVGIGGEEIDVRADYKIPSLGREQTIRLICECKAHQSALGTTDWLKFLGKILVEDLQVGNITHGCLIALNGVNGNVAGSYDDIHRRRDNIQLISGDMLANLTSRIFNTASIDKIQTKLRSYTERQFQQAELAYYNQQMYWIIAFEGGEFSILDSSGEIARDKDSAILIPLIENTTSYHPFINLQQEQEAIRRNNLVQRAIVTMLMAREGRAEINEIDVNSILMDDANYTRLEMERAIVALIDKNIIAMDAPNTQLLLLVDTDDSAESYISIIELFRFLLNDIVVIETLRTNYYKRHINRHLLRNEN